MTILFATLYPSRSFEMPKLKIVFKVMMGLESPAKWQSTSSNDADIYGAFKKISVNFCQIYSSNSWSTFSWVAFYINVRNFTINWLCFWRNRFPISFRFNIINNIGLKTIITNSHFIIFTPTRTISNRRTILFSVRICYVWWWSFSFILCACFNFSCSFFLLSVGFRIRF